MMKVLERFYVIVLVIVILSFFYGCEKEEDINKLPSIPILIEPSTGSVINDDNVTFSWQCEDKEGDDILYTLYISEDSINWEEANTINSLSISLHSSGNPSDWDYYVFNKGDKYFWKVKAENRFYDNAPVQESSESISNVSYFYSTPPGVNNLRDSSGHEYVNLYWEDPENIDHIEITFEPAVSGISQPILVNAGISKYEFSGMENGTVYNFYLKAFNNLGHASENDTIKSLPLDPTQIHDADFNIYNITKIGEQTWLRENLHTTLWQDGTKMTYNTNYRINEYSDIYGYYYYANSTFGEGAQGKNPCPCGYHVPSDDEWKELEAFLGMPEAEINRYSEGSTTFYRGVGLGIADVLKTSSGWLDYNGESGNGIDIFMFNLLPAGFYWGGIYDYGEATILHSSTKYYNYYIYRHFSYKSDGIGRYSYDLYGSIRCIKD